MEFNVHFQHKYGYIRDEGLVVCSRRSGGRALRMSSRRAVSGLRSREVGVARAQRRPDAAEHASELAPESGVAERIEERIQRGVEVSDPGGMVISDPGGIRSR